MENVEVCTFKTSNSSHVALSQHLFLVYHVVFVQNEVKSILVCLQIAQQAQTIENKQHKTSNFVFELQ